MTTQELQNKKITLSTVKSFIRKSNELYVLVESSFSGMDDCVMQNNDQKWIPVSKENALGIEGAYIVGGSRDYFAFYQDGQMFGIEIFNSCGSSILATKKVAA
jgi:hypothetical protein